MVMHERLVLVREDRADRSRVFRACFCPSRAIATANYKIHFILSQNLYRTASSAGYARRFTLSDETFPGKFFTRNYAVILLRRPIYLICLHDQINFFNLINAQSFFFRVADT